MKKCPACAEEIQDEAKKCKHCGEFLAEPPPALEAPPKPPAAATKNATPGQTCCLGCFVFVAVFFGYILMNPAPPRPPSNPPPPPAAAKPAATEGPALKIDWSRRIEDDYLYVEGTAKNLTGHQLEYVQAMVTVTDKADKFITTESAYLEYKNLNPGESSPFKMMIRYRPNMENCSIQFESQGEKLESK